MKKTLIYTIVVFTILFMLWNPITRQFIFWILPMGSGIDDLLFIIVLIFGMTVLLTMAIKAHKEVIAEQIKNNWKWFVVGAIIFLIVVLLSIQVYPIY